MHRFVMVRPETSMACKMGIPAVSRVLMVWANWLAPDIRTISPTMGIFNCARARAGPPFSVSPYSRRRKTARANTPSSTSPQFWKKRDIPIRVLVTQGSSISRLSNMPVKVGTA